MTKQATRGWSAMASAWRMPRGVSIMHQTGRPAGAPAASRTAQARRTASADSTLGSRMAPGPAAAMAARSAWPQGVSRPLTRTTSSRRP